MNEFDNDLSKSPKVKVDDAIKQAIPVYLFLLVFSRKAWPNLAPLTVSSL